MTRSTLAAAVCAAVLIGLTACTPTTPDTDPTTASSDDPSATETAADDSAAEEPGQPATESAPAEDSPEPSADAEDDQPTENSVTVDLGGESAVVEPTDVYCAGSPGDIQHIIGKTDHRPPLVEVSGTHFAMVKLEQRGAPERTENPQGLDYGEDWVTFSDVSIGSATVNGAMVCTEWED